MRPRWRGALNAWERADRSRRLVWSFFGAMTLGFWVGVLAVCIYFVDNMARVELFGPVMAQVGLSMLLLAFSGLLVFSNINTALASYFMSEDMQLIQALPISERKVFYLRAVDTMINSSWMILIFGLPVLLAYGIVYGGGPVYYLVATGGLLAYLIPPAALGIVIACLLVRGFSASRIREVMAAVGAVFLIIVLLLLRNLEPERLVDPEAFGTLVEFIAVLRTPDAAWLPSRWLTDLLMWSLGRPLDAPLLSAGLLFMAGPSLLIAVRWVVAPLWFEAWTQAQEAPKRVAGRSRLASGLIDTLTRPFPHEYRALMRKDIRVFMREPGQWTQAMLLLGLVAIYLNSVRSLPLDKLPLEEVTRNVIGFLNVGVVGAVLAAIAVRFNFTAVSQEGRAFWVLHSSPVGARRFLWGKFLVGFVPTLVLGEVLVVATNALLHTDPLFAWIGTGTVLCLSVGVTGLAIGLGALYPNFKADSAARMASGPGAILFMVMGLSWTALVVTAEAIPLGILFYRQYNGLPLGTGLLVSLGAVGAGVVLLNLAVAIVPIRMGAAKLWGDLGNVGD